MDTAILRLRAACTRDEVRRVLSKRWNTEDTSLGGVVVHGLDTRVYVTFEENGQVLELDYSDVDLVKKVIGALLEAVLMDEIDTGFGTRLEGMQFLRKINNDPNWDWRKKQP